MMDDKDLIKKMKRNLRKGIKRRKTLQYVSDFWSLALIIFRLAKKRHLNLVKGCICIDF